MAHAVSLAHATQDEINNAFVYVDVRPLPGSDLIYVLQRHKAGRVEPHLINNTGNWVAAVDFIEPIFSGDPAEDLYPARQNYPNNKWGYINRRGEWVIPPQYGSAEPFANDMALVFKEKSYQFIDTQGRPIPDLVIHHRYPLVIMKDWIISDDAWYVRNPDGSWKKSELSYKWVQPFNDQAIMARGQDNKQLLLDRNGKQISGEQFDAAGMENSQVAAKDGKWGLLDARGNWRTAPQFEFLAANEDGSFRALQHGKLVLLDKNGKQRPEGSYLPIAKPSEGLTAACVELRCGYVDESGRWVVPAKFDKTFSFSEGIARVLLNGLVLYIDHQGSLLTPLPPYNAASPALSHPEALATGRNEAYFGYIGRDGKYLLAPFYNHLGEFSENLAPAQGINGRFGYVDPSGKWAIPPIFSEARNFSDGVALVRGAGGETPFYNSISYIDANGRRQLVLPGSMQSAGDFKNGCARMTDYGGKAWFIGKSGETIQEETTCARSPAQQPDLQRLSVNGGQWGYADANDRFVIAPRFDEANDFAGEYAAVKIDGQWGYINRSGKIIVQPAYEEAAPFNEGLARVKKDEHWKYIDEHGHAISEDSFVYAGDFHGGRAKVGLDLESMRRFAAGIAAEKMFDAGNNVFIKSPDGKLIPIPYTMLSEGSDMHNGVAAIKLAPNRSDSLFALMNKSGEIIIPSAVPK